MFRDKAAKQSVTVEIPTSEIPTSEIPTSEITAARTASPETGLEAARTQAPTTYPVDDLVSLGEEKVAALIAQAHADQETGLATCPHLVITRDLRTGVVNHYVPCATGAEALRLAVDVVAEKLASDPQREFTVTVTPLLPH
ncbi:MAG TPA: hypothetical protein VFE15_14690 [Marmoricola sp.]|jgi:hypothetical protein|nr:hypothetical protein [Marmoricola sp.]